MRMILFVFMLLTPAAVFCQTNDDSTFLENVVFTKVEVEASFPGGMAGWRSFLEKNLNPNVPVEHGAPIGIYNVMVQFIVDRNGSISDIKMLTNIGFGMEEEVLRILQISPQWIPAMQNKRTVKAYRKQPVTFVVEQEGFDVITKEKYIFYTGMDNRISFKIDEVKNEDLLLVVSQGDYKPNGTGGYIINVNTIGKLIIYVHNKKKNNELLGAVYFNVLPKPE